MKCTKVPGKLATHMQIIVCIINFTECNIIACVALEGHITLAKMAENSSDRSTYCFTRSKKILATMA